jgi:hypothetical protein
MKVILIGGYFMEQFLQQNVASDLDMNDLIFVLLVVNRRI